MITENKVKSDFLFLRLIQQSRIRMISLLLTVVFSQSLIADVHRWVDKDGKVHYSDKEVDGVESEKIEINDKYAIPKVERKTPIKYEREEKNRTIAISSIVLDMPGSQNEDVRIGRITCGKQGIDIYWTKGVTNLENRELGDTIAAVFTDAGYTTEAIIGSSPSVGSLELRASLKNIKMNSCRQSDIMGNNQSNRQSYTRSYRQKSFQSRSQERTKNATYVEINWALYDPSIDETLVQFTTKGSDNSFETGFIADGFELSFESAISASVANLLALEDFHKHIKPGNLAELKQSFDENVAVDYVYGEGSEKFKQAVNQLKNNSVVIKTEKGHGSGVLINNKGFVLTNAHVVGDEKEFDITVGKEKYQANLIRKEKVRDVALVKIIDYKGEAEGVKFSRSLPNIGDELYVIGTPLSLDFEHSITKGIVSAKRNLSGLPFYQTDAAINPGNSGGPVFDASGELIALTVSGMFTRSGASLNINYLIPIEDAVGTLKIESQFAFSSITMKLQGKTVFGGVKILLEEFGLWLNEPVVKLF